MVDTNASRPSPELVRAAFRELHGRHLHGFTLLLTLGDRPLAGRLTADALAEGADRAGELRHPERAAAWLRAHVVRHVGTGLTLGAARRAVRHEAEREKALAELGVESAVVAGLSALDLRERALIVAETLEGLAPLDVEAVTGADRRRLARLRQNALSRYAAAFAKAWDASGVPPSGPIADRIRASLGGAWR